METQENSSNPPAGFVAELVPAPDDTTLGIRNEGRVNRSLATQEAIGSTSYSVYLRHVQYGTYEGRSACLVAIDISFRFPTNSSSRVSSAEVDVTFEKALNPNNPSRRCQDALLDPVVVNFSPKTILGQVRERANHKTLELEVPLTFEAPFGSVNVFNARWSRETTMTEEGRAELYGNLAQDDEHDDGANSVVWDLRENSVSKDGILRSFRAVVVLHLRRAGEAIWMRVDAKPVVKFSLDPRRMFTKRLLRQGDEPILLDGKSQMGSPECLGHESSAFDAEDFPWEAILNISGLMKTSEI